MNQSYLVVMAGGSGTRFWPKSTSSRPKQLLRFGRSETAPTLLGQTLSRFDGIVETAKRWIVTTESLLDGVAEVAPGAKVLAEPQGRNTAPCVYWAAREVAKENPQAVMMVMPADHYMERPEDFQKTLRQAIHWAETHDDLVTLGVKPTRPETGYGYLELGASLGDGVQQTKRFVEKPNRSKAEEFLAAGNFLWNGGMFLWRAEVILDAFDHAMPEYKQAWDACNGDVQQAYPKLNATSIDFGVMEKASNVVTFPIDCGWDDLGSWPSLENVADVLHAREGENVISDGELISIESSGNIIDTPGRLTSLLGVKDLIIVENGDAILIADKARAQDIKQVVEAVKAKRSELA